MIRYGTLTGNSPWDGVVRTWSVMLLLFLPRELHLSLSLTTAFSVVGALGLEISLWVAYNIFDYKCGCYSLVNERLNTVSDHFPMSIHSPRSHLCIKTALLQGISITISWAFLLILVYKIHRSIDLGARESFVRVKDKNAELATMGEQKQVLEQEMALQQEIAKSEARAAKRVSSAALG